MDKYGLSHQDYTVGWICTLVVEKIAALEMLDEHHPNLPQPTADHNVYSLGSIGDHNVVIASLHQAGNQSAATVAGQMMVRFPNLKFGLLVGIAGGVPTKTESGMILLGDVVVSKPTGEHSGAIQYDSGKARDGYFEHTGSIVPPPRVLLNAVHDLEAQRCRMDEDPVAKNINRIDTTKPRLRKYRRPSPEHDYLYRPDYCHLDPKYSCDDCGCDPTQRVQRSTTNETERRSSFIVAHMGTIASGGAVMRSGQLRDRLAHHYGALCFEMEAAGALNDFPCLVIRGISDYSDSHKNDQWHGYAAAAAAAYARELFFHMPVDEERSGRPRKAFSLGLNLSDAPTVESRVFIGREQELAKMEAILKPNELLVEQRRLVLGGMGGIGKTQLAIAFAERHRYSYESIFWLNATSSKTLQASLHQLAQHILPPDELKHCDDNQLIVHVSRWLSETDNTRWLLIFDNYDEPDQYQITKYYPHASHGSIIITTRLPHLVRGAVIKVQHLDRLEDSLHILETRSERQNVKSDADARSLAKRLHGLPLALATAGAFLKRSALSFKQYLDAYEKHWDITPTRHTNLPEYEARTFYTTWNLSFRRLEQEDPGAAQLLTLLAYFDNQDVWYELFSAGKSRVGWLAALAANEVAFASAMGKLVEYCLVENHSETNSYSMHTCVHDWTLHGLNREVDVDKYWLAFDCVAASIANEDSDYFSELKFQPLAAHAARLVVHDRFRGARNLDKASDQRIEETLDIAEMLYQQIQYDAAEKMYQRALQRQEQALGPEHPSTLTTVNNLGVLYRDQGKLDQAEAMYRRALQGYEKALGPEHPSTLTTVNNLGSLYRDQGKLDQAEAMNRRALQGYEKALGPEHPSTLTTVNNLGSLYGDQGKLDQAEAMNRRALQGREKALGPEHPSTLQTVNNLGVLYSDQGKLDQAEAMYRRALQGNENALGPEHTSTLTTVNNLGNLYAEQGKLDQAEAMYRRALQGKEKALGPEHPSTLTTVNNLAVLYRGQGKLDQAEAMYRRALQGQEQALGPEHPYTLRTVGNLSTLYRDQGKLDQAEAMYRRALQ